MMTELFIFAFEPIKFRLSKQEYELLDLRFSILKSMDFLLDY